MADPKKFDSGQAGGRVSWAARNRSLMAGSVAIAALFAAWQFIALTQPPYVFPGLGIVFRSLWGFVHEGELLTATVVTAQSVLIGSLLALAVGCLAGFSLARYEAFTSPLINFVQTVPYIVWALMSMIWFGLTRTSVVFTIFVAAFPIITFNVAAGLKNVDPLLLEMARSVRASRVMVLRHITLPSLMPYLLSAARSMFGMSWKISVIAELFAGGSGIGHRLFLAWEFSRTSEVFAWTVWLVVLMLATEWLLLKPIDVWVSRWKTA